MIINNVLSSIAIILRDAQTVHADTDTDTDTDNTTSSIAPDPNPIILSFWLFCIPETLP
ncbi:hypothetical protein H2248_010550 [Termitomyces sp. 'cryptogamus']|nr:hypothetical protein H2248_010550 [Termitomyces sp. 'cryptogamus']